MMNMKKIMGLTTAVCLSMGLLSGCSEIFGKKANGIVAYGNQKDVEQLGEKNKKDIKEQATYPAKLIEQDNKKILIFSEKTANDLIKKEMLQKVVNNDETKPIKELTKVTDTGGLLFAKEKIDIMHMGNLPLHYEGNIVIGEGRMYSDMFAVVSEQSFKGIKGKETSIGVFHFKKDPKHEIPTKEDRIEAAHLVTIPEK